MSTIRSNPPRVFGEAIVTRSRPVSPVSGRSYTCPRLPPFLSSLPLPVLPCPLLLPSPVPRPAQNVCSGIPSARTTPSAPMPRAPPPAHARPRATATTTTTTTSSSPPSSSAAPRAGIVPHLHLATATQLGSTSRTRMSMHRILAFSAHPPTLVPPALVAQVVTPPLVPHTHRRSMRSSRATTTPPRTRLFCAVVSTLSYTACA